MSARRMGVYACTLLMAAGMGCESSQRTTSTTETRRSTTTAARQSDRDVRVAADTTRMHTASMAFPTGEKGSSVLMVQKRLPAQVRAGQPFEYEILVTNLTDQPLDQVVVFDRLPRGVAIRRADEPRAVTRATTVREPSRFATAGRSTDETLPRSRGGYTESGTLREGVGGHAQDEFVVRRADENGVYANPADPDRYPYGLAPGREFSSEQPDGRRPGEMRTTTTITERTAAPQSSERMYAGRILQPGDAEIGGEWRVGHLNPKETKTLRVTGTADEAGLLQSCTTVSYMPALCMATEVIQPQIRLERIAPAEASACEDVTIRYRVTNTGTGTASNIRVMEQFPEGLRADRRDALFTVDELGQGQSKEFTTTVRADRAGRIVGRAVATDSFGTRVESQEGVTVLRAPELEVSLSAPEVFYAAVPVDYRVRVTNKGSGVARNVSIHQSLPTGARVTNATLGGRQSGNEATWNIDTLGPGESREMAITLVGANEGASRSTVRASAACAEEVSATIQNRVEALAAILLEVVDTNDPVQVGNEERYVIRVTNQGNKADTNIRLAVTLPDEMEFASTAGALRPQAQEGKNVTFVIPSLAPKQSQEIQLNARAIRAGDLRIRVEMTSEQLTKPVMETEATRAF